MRMSASQRACCDSVQSISSQSMRPTSGLARAQMISPARRVLTVNGPPAAIHLAYVCMLFMRKRFIFSNTIAISGSTADAVRRISAIGRSSVEMPAMNFANSSSCLR